MAASAPATMTTVGAPKPIKTIGLVSLLPDRFHPDVWRFLDTFCRGLTKVLCVELSHERTDTPPRAPVVIRGGRQVWVYSESLWHAAWWKEWAAAEGAQCVLMYVPSIHLSLAQRTLWQDGVLDFWMLPVQAPSRDGGSSYRAVGSFLNGLETHRVFTAATTTWPCWWGCVPVDTVDKWSSADKIMVKELWRTWHEHLGPTRSLQGSWVSVLD